VTDPHGCRHLLDDVLGEGFSILTTDPMPSQASPLRDPEGALRRWFAERDCTAVVVRPDRYVYGTARDQTEIDRLVEALNREIRGDCAQPVSTFSVEPGA
jgi:hypothetical protein